MELTQSTIKPLAVTLALIALGTGSANAAPVSHLRRDLRSARSDLKEAGKANRRLSASVRRLNAETIYLTKAGDDLKAQNLDLRAQNDRLASDKQVLAETNAQLTTDNTNLKAGLPDAILAVPVNEFTRLVFAPARQAWPCDSFYSSDGFYSYTFDSPSFC